jgi:hypothetical protein
MLAEPEARMWQDALQQQGIGAMVKRPTASSELGYSLTDYSLWTTGDDAERAMMILDVAGEDERQSRKT